MSHDIAPSGDHGIKLAWLPVGPLPPAPPAPATGPAVILRPQFIGIPPCVPASDPIPVYLFPFIEDWDLIYVGGFGSSTRLIKHRRTGQFLQPNYHHSSTPSKIHIEVADEKFEWVLRPETADGVVSWHISAKHDDAEWGVGLDLLYGSPPGDSDEGVLPPIRLHSLVLKPKAEAARWTFPNVYVPKK